MALNGFNRQIDRVVERPLAAPELGYSVNGRTTVYADAPVVYQMMGLDSTGTWVYWETVNPYATPLVTTPPATGSIGFKAIL